MIQRLLLPVDGSTFSTAAVEVGLSVAAAIRASLEVLHVVNVRPASGNFLTDLTGRLGFEPAIVPAELADHRMQEAHALVDQVVERARAAGVRATSRVEVGVVSDVVLQRCHDADLVVIGLRGQTEDRFPGQGGQMSSWLPQRAPCPVLLVPREVSGIQAVALGFDGSPAARHALRVAAQLAAGLGVPLHPFHVSPDGSEGGDLLEEAAQLVAPVPVDARRVAGERAHTTLVEAARGIGANLLAVGYLGKKPIKDLFYGSATERILCDHQQMVLVVR